MTPEQTLPIYEQLKKDITEHFGIKPTNIRTYDDGAQGHSRKCSIYINTKTIIIIITHMSNQIRCRVYDEFTTGNQHVTTQLLAQEGSYTIILEHIKHAIRKLKGS